MTMGMEAAVHREQDQTGSDSGSTGGMAGPSDGQVSQADCTDGSGQPYSPSSPSRNRRNRRRNKKRGGTNTTPNTTQEHARSAPSTPQIDGAVGAEPPERDSATGVQGGSCPSRGWEQPRCLQQQQQPQPQQRGRRRQHQQQPRQRDADQKPAKTQSHGADQLPAALQPVTDGSAAAGEGGSGRGGPQVEQSPVVDQHCLIFIDWDDTLFPTTELCCRLEMELEAVQPLQPLQREALGLPAVEAAAIKLLDAAAAIGVIKLVSNSSAGWVIESALAAAPRLYEWLTTHNIEIVHSRPETDDDLDMAGVRGGMEGDPAM